MTVDDFLKEWHSEEPFVVAHTSGSTGKPKEIKLLKADMRASAALTNRFFSIDSGSTLLLCLSPDYIAGKMMIVRAEEAGATLLVESPSNRPLEHFQGLPSTYSPWCRHRHCGSPSTRNHLTMCAI